MYTFNVAFLGWINKIGITLKCYLCDICAVLLNVNENAQSATYSGLVVKHEFYVTSKINTTACSYVYIHYTYTVLK